MADAEDLLEQTRQKLVQIVRLMMRYMDNRSRGDSRFFRDLVERQAPGMPAMIDQGRGIPETSAQIDQFLQPGWDDRLTQAFGVIRDDHPVFQDPAVQQANNEYLALRSQAAAQRAPQITGASVAITETSAFGRPGATRAFRDLTATPAAATTPTAPPGPTQTPRPAAAPARPSGPASAPGPAQPSRPASAPGSTQPSRPTAAPSPAQTSRPAAPGPGQAARPAGAAPAVQSPAARAGQQAGPVGPGGQATPPATRAPGVGGQPAPPQPQRPGTGQAPGAGPTPPRTQAGPGQAPRTGAQPTAQGAQPASAQVGEGTTRTFTSATGGPVKLDAQLLGAAGRVVVRADPNCTEARITLSTADQSGPAADAVRDATLESSPDGTVTASAQQRQSGISVVQSGPQPGAGNIVGDGYVVHNGNVVSSYYTNSPNGSSVSVVSHSGSGSIVAGRIDNLSFNNGNIQIGSIEGGAFVIGQAASPIEMEVIVPEGSSVECSTDSANLETHGKVDVVEAKSATGSVSVEQATEARIETDTGNVDVQSAGAVQAESDTGNVTVQEARTVRAESDTGNVTVGNAETVRAESDTGNVTVRNADKVNARSDTGAINIGTSKDATARSKTGAVSITDARGTAKASSGIGPVSVHATEGGKVTASSALRPVTVTASDKAVSDGLTVKAEGPPGQVRTPEGANTGTSTAAGSDGARSFNDANRADRSRDAGTARD